MNGWICNYRDAMEAASSEFSAIQFPTQAFLLSSASIDTVDVFLLPLLILGFTFSYLSLLGSAGDCEF